MKAHLPLPSCIRFPAPGDCDVTLPFCHSEKDITSLTLPATFQVASPVNIVTGDGRADLGDCLSLSCAWAH